METLLVGLEAGLAAGTILAFFSYVAPRFGAGNFVRELEPPAVRGRVLDRRETHVTGLLIHLAFSGVLGVVFAGGVRIGWIPGFTVWSVLVYSVVVAMLIGLLVMPLEGHGLFGRKHDAWFMADALITTVLWGALYLALLHLWRLGS